MLGRGDCGATAAAAAAAAAYLEAATAELFQGGRTDVDVVDVIAVTAGVIAAVGVGVCVGGVLILPFCRKLRDRMELRSKPDGANGVIVSLASLVAARRGGLGGGGAVVDGQLLEFSEPLSLIVSELMLFFRCVFGLAGVATTGF